MAEKRPARQMSFFQTGVHRLELARQADGLLFLTAFSGDFPIDLSLVAAAHPIGEWLVQLLGDQAQSCLVPVSRLTAVRSLLENCQDAGLVIEIDPSVSVLQELQLCDAPVLSYRWSAEEQMLKRDLQTNYHGQGWFSRERCYWHWPEVDDQDENWLGRVSIGGAELVDFLTRALPSWQDRDFPVESDLSFFPEPLQRFRSQSVEPDKVVLRVDWPEEVDGQSTAIDALPGFVLVQDVVRPGLAESLLEQFERKGPELVLRGEQIPGFLQQLGPQRPLLMADPEEKIEQAHRCHAGAGRLVLVGHREDRRGIGTVHAVPTWQIGGASVPAAEVSYQLERAESFLRVGDGWVSKDQVQASGIGRFGRASNGYTLDPISLTPLEVLWRGSPRLDGPWEGLDFPEIALPEAGTPAEVATLHLQFLARMGLPGGILGSVNRYANQLLAFLDGYATGQPDGRVLIVGTKTVLNYLSKLARPGALLRLDQQPAGAMLEDPAPGMVGLTPNWLERSQGLERIDWDIVFLVNADSLIKSRSSALYRRLHGLHKLLFLGLFADLGFRQRNAARAAMAELMGIDEIGPQLLWRFLLRDPEETPRELVAPYRASRWGTRVATGAEYELPTLGGADRPLTVTYQAERLVEAATYLSEQLQGKKILPVPFVEYYHPRPTLGSMNNQQLSWYIYWRDRVRQGEYLDTGLDYIIIYGAELINQVDVPDALTAYARLRDLWLGYRENWPSLDHSLLHWLVDHLLEQQLPIDPLEPYREALALGVAVPAVDQLLQPYTAASWEAVPLELLSCLSNYQLQRSRFLQSGHLGLLEHAIGVAFQTADDYYQATYGQGIWQFYRPRRRKLQRRRLFQNAPYSGKSRLVSFSSVFPYSEQAALRALVTTVIKYTENTLRQRFGYRGKLRIHKLPDELAAQIDLKLGRVTKPSVVTRRQIAIDLQQVKRLTEQSNQVRDLLLRLVAEPSDVVLAEESLPEQAPPPDLGTLHREQPEDDLLPEEEWPALFARLGETEISALRVLTAEATEPSWQSFCQQTGALPQLLVDRINTFALETIGDLLLDADAGTPQIQPEYRSIVLRQLEQVRGE